MTAAAAVLAMACAARGQQWTYKGGGVVITHYSGFAGSARISGPNNFGPQGDPFNDPVMPLPPGNVAVWVDYPPDPLGFTADGVRKSVQVAQFAGNFSANIGINSELRVGGVGGADTTAAMNVFVGQNFTPGIYLGFGSKISQKNNGGGRATASMLEVVYDLTYQYNGPANIPPGVLGGFLLQNAPKYTLPGVGAFFQMEQTSVYSKVAGLGGNETGILRPDSLMMMTDPDDVGLAGNGGAYFRILAALPAVTETASANDRVAMAAIPALTFVRFAGILRFWGHNNPGDPMDVDWDQDQGQAPAGMCYANCDGSTATPYLNVADFTCFLQRYANNDPYANCDGSVQPPVLNVSDFTCFLQAYANGCAMP